MTSSRWYSEREDADAKGLEMELIEEEDKELKATQAALIALRPLELDQQGRALRWLSEKLGVSIKPQSDQTGVVGSSDGSDSLDQNPQTPKQFLSQKKPRTDVERIACLAYYLTHVRGTPHFKTRDLTTLNTDAAGSKFSNATVSTKNALQHSKFLAAAGKGNRQITAIGEAIVDALPDYAAVAKVIAERPKRKQRSRSKKKISAAE